METQTADNQNLDPVKKLEGQNVNPTRHIQYTIDLTREYHNLLERTEESRSQRYFWDGNVAAYEENGERNYYLQDELGSPLRIQSGAGETEETYGYGAFGEDLYQNQGKLQPFGYTGYQRDEIAGTYYAQAREYQAEAGRFAGQDKIVGLVGVPIISNGYIYCVQQPLDKTDMTGYWFGIDDAIAAGIGAAVNVVARVASDVVTSVVRGELYISPWQEYVGSAIGGAVGGVTTLYAGPVIGAMAEGGVSTLTAEGIKAVTEPEYTKTFTEVMKETAWDTLFGGAAAFALGGFKADDGISAIANSYKKTYKKVYKNPAIQKLLSSDRKYYVNKALKELQKAKESYAEEVLILAKAALLEGISFKELKESVLKDKINSGIKNLYASLIKVVEERKEIIEVECIEG